MRKILRVAKGQAKRFVDEAATRGITEIEEREDVDLDSSQVFIEPDPKIDRIQARKNALYSKLGATQSDPIAMTLPELFEFLRLIHGYPE